MASDRANHVRQSLRVSGLRNIAISLAVAGSSYLSLMLIARRFGGSVGCDAYFFLFSFSTVTAELITGIYATVFLPQFIELRVKASDVAATDFAATMLAATLLVIGPLAAAAYVFYVPFFSLVTRFSPEQLATVRPVLILFPAVFIFSVLSEFYRTLLLALGLFTVAAVGALFQPLLLIGATLWLSDSLQEQALSGSLLVAKLAMLALAAMTFARRWPGRLRPHLRGTQSLRRFASTAAPYWSATMVTNFAVFYFDYVATGLATGVLSAIAYAQRIFALPSSIILNPLLEIARTRFSECRARGDHEGFLHQHNRLMQFTLYFSVPIAAMFWLFPSEIMSSLFQRGAFGQQNVETAANCLRTLALSLPFSCLFMLNGRAVESFQRLLWPSVFGTVGNLLLILATYVLAAREGYLGIPLAKLGVDVAYFFPFGFIALHQFSKGIEFDRLGRVLLSVGAGTLVAALSYHTLGVGPAIAPHFPSLCMLACVLGGFMLLFIATAALIDGRPAAWLRTRTRA